MYMLLFFAMIVVLLVFKIIYIRREYIYLNTDYSVYVVMFMPFAIYYALKYVDNITSATALNWLCTVPMSMYLYQSVYFRFKQFDMLIVYSLMGIFINLIVFKKTETSVYKGYKRDKIEMRGDRAEMSDFPLYLNTVAGGLDRRDQTIGGFSFVVKIYAVPVVEIIGQLLYLLGRYGFNAQFGDCL